MKHNKSIIVFIILVLCTGLQAQFNESEFLYRAKTTYHSLKVTGLDNFSSWVTSNIFLESTKDVSQEDIYPLEIIWKNPDLLYYIKRPLPQVLNAEKLKEVQQNQLDMIRELQGLMIDWQRFFAGNILDELPETHLITIKDDTVHVEYELFEEGKNIKTRILYGKNGLCLKIITQYSHKNEEIYVYPGFTVVEDKWLCNRWRVQIYKNNEIDSGFEISLKSRKVEDYWLPERLILKLQKKGIDNTLFLRDYKFRNVIVNKDLQVLK